MTQSWLSESVINNALNLATLEQEPILNALEKISGRSTEHVLNAVATHVNIARLALGQMELMAPDFADISYATALQYECLVLKDTTDDTTYFVTSNPFKTERYTWASYQLKSHYKEAFAHHIELKEMLSRMDSTQGAISQLISLDETTQEQGRLEEISLDSIANNDSQVVRLVNSTLYDAHKSLASDIHFENTQDGLIIKYRIDGVLTEARVMESQSLAEQVISRLKVMAELDIAEKRIPQDGRFSVKLQNREIDFRVSLMPGIFGEDAVLRILDKQSISEDITQLNLDKLGIDADTKQLIRKLATKPHGMLLVTGPTGSGKTTSLYATLSEINFGSDKVITIEDPVEYQLPGVLQIPVNEKKGLTFVKGLRSILRHDPDRILVGEIRDRETAEIAIQAALTGHLVYTTVHANNAFDVLSRFRHMGVDAYSFLSCLNGVVAQRLVRLNCSHCAAAYSPDDDTVEASNIDLKTIKNYNLKRGKGCLECRNTGYKGRFAIAEVLMLNDKLRECMMRDVPISELKELAINQGMQLMRDQGLNAVKNGLTTLEEINRVIFTE